ncbi:DinB family protein [Micromonospora sp. DT229]|uniref:DinB family protein n=1 Tax=Micromonospora sp. DT229 TaxID=3393430 RepID=UPI003CF16646
MAEPTLSAERADLLETLQLHRFFLRNTTRDLTDEQIALRSTVSELCLGGLIKHVAGIERSWVDFIQVGPTAFPGITDTAAMEQHAKRFQVSPGETLASVLATYDEAAKQTDDLIRTLPDLDLSQPLPEAPWFAPGARWSARRVLLHLIAETAQHAGHADIVREAIDGAKSMG